jgi:hypothetical protein
MAGILLEGDHVTDEERAAHACALAAKEREKSLKRATEVKARVHLCAVLGDHLLDDAARQSPAARDQQP